MSLSVPGCAQVGDEAGRRGADHSYVGGTWEGPSGVVRWMKP